MVSKNHSPVHEAKMMEELRLAFCKKIDEFVEEQLKANLPMKHVLATLHFFGFSLTLPKKGDNHDQ